MGNVFVGEGATINYSIIDSEAQIGPGAVIGRTRSTPENISVIGSGVIIPAGRDVPAGTIVSQANKTDPLRGKEKKQ